MPDPQKQRLAKLTAERGIAVIEDDIYGDLHFGEQRPWPIKAFDQSGNVLFCSSFSKSLSPTIRLGFIAAGRYHDRISLLKTITSGSTNPITQQVVAEYLESSAYLRHLHRLRRNYQRQVDAVRTAVSRYFPASTRMTQPQGGFVLWVELPEEINTSALHQQAIASGIAYVPGELFSPSRMYRNCLRLNCGNPYTPQIEAAIQSLGRLFGQVR
jgi:DNA-binding transcriptional MocR family regulator